MLSNVALGVMAKAAEMYMADVPRNQVDTQAYEVVTFVCSMKVKMKRQA